MSQYVIDAEIIPGYRTDHSGITLKLKLLESERGKGYWKFNNTLLKDHEYVTLIKNTIEDVKKTYVINRNDVNIANDEIQFNINDQLFLETLLMMIKGITIKYSSEKKKKRVKEEKALEEDIKRLENEICLNGINVINQTLVNLVQKQNELINLRNEKIEGVMLRSKCRYMDLGEKPTNYFFSLETRNYTCKVINKGSLTLAMGKCLWFSVKIKVWQSSLSSPWSYPDLSTLWLWNPFSILNASRT